MRKLKHILPALAVVVGLTLSCVDPLEQQPITPDNLYEGALVFSPSVVGLNVATKADGTEEVVDPDPLGESVVNTLDIYVFEKIGTSINFFKEYHFTKKEPSEAQIALGFKQAANLGVVYSEDNPTAPDILLESSWKSAGYKLKEGNNDVKYRVYAIANSELPDESRCNLSNITLPEDQTIEGYLKSLSSTSRFVNSCYDIVRPKEDGVGPTQNDPYYDAPYYNIHIADKSFVMDGFIDDWMIQGSNTKQYITENRDLSYSLERAAAKFDVTVTFDQEFVEKGLTEKEYYEAQQGEEPKLKTLKVTTIGRPFFKFTNFMPMTYEIRPSEPHSTDNLWISEYRYYFPYPTVVTETQIVDDETVQVPVDYTFPYRLITYGYSYKWDEASAAELSPSLLVSFGFTTTTTNYNTDGEEESTTTDPIEYHYYRIPLVDTRDEYLDEQNNLVSQDPITEIERNTMYTVVATLKSFGSTSVDIESRDVVLKYKVIPWPNDDVYTTEAEAKQLHYFVADQNFRLRGDRAQTVYLQYFTPKSDALTGDNQGFFEFSPKIHNIKVYYYKQGETQGTPLYQTGSSQPMSYKWDSKTNNTVDENVSISVEPNSDGVSGNFYITSMALESRAVKYITFEATVTFEDGSTKTLPFKITHFPLDNIQSIAGSWSTKNAITEVSTTQQSGSGWFSNSEYRTYLTYNQWYQNRSNSTRVVEERSTPFIQQVYIGDGMWGDYYTWQQAYNAGYYTTEGQGNQRRYAYYSEPYYYWFNGTTYYRALYYRTSTAYYKLSPSDRWVNWDNDANKSVNPPHYTYDGSNFQAKVFNNNLVYAINTVDVDNNRNYYSVATSQRPYTQYGYNYYYNWYMYSVTNEYVGAIGSFEGLDNNNMYVIQISKAESGVVLGRPSIENFQSKDDVVSPAFMIASQLGAVSSFASNNNPALEAAMHCASYVEVSHYTENGQKSRWFTGWRLPTKAEIAYIIHYQGNTPSVQAGVFKDVLTGGYYYTLDGGYAETNYIDESANYAVRCVRDLTPKEIEELNSDSHTITNHSLE